MWLALLCLSWCLTGASSLAGGVVLNGYRMSQFDREQQRAANGMSATMVSAQLSRQEVITPLVLQGTIADS
jgi:hypothetical protein